ncbi:MAG TPA: leucine--tRNA ligase, partial [Bacteroidetes bacterium]|nr:leucine--tRNA ligase [Bacteroidota bacterium]
MVLAPEHPLVASLSSDVQRPAVLKYQSAAKLKSELDRGIDADKTGVFTGGYVINPATGKDIPVWIADYVLMGYGTGAIMAVPGHDERDHAFAKKFGLSIVEVVSGGNVDGAAFIDDGLAVNSANDSFSLNGLPTAEAKKRTIDWLAK